MGGEGVFLVVVVGELLSLVSPALLPVALALEESSAAFFVSPVFAGSDFGPAIFQSSLSNILN